MMKIRAPLAILAGTCVVLGLTACNDSKKNADKSPLNERPDFVSGDIQATEYDGTNNDLLTAGLGATGLASTPAPTFADAINPTAEELRTLAIYNNYRALVDTVPGGGYGSLFGPQVNATDPEGKIPGDEYLAFMTVPGAVPVTVMVQVPNTFDPQDACMVTAPSSGSRGIYGAIGTAGEWGLKKGCAVVYTDKGSGTGSHNLATNTAQTLIGQQTNENICNSLGLKGLVAGTGVDAQATDALRVLNEEFGIQPEQNLLAPTHFGLAVAQSISMTYANAYGRFGVEDRVCGLSLAATNASTGEVAVLTDAQEAALFSVSNGIPPTGGVNLVFDNAAQNVPTNLPISSSQSTGVVDYGLDALLCLRALAAGLDPETGDPLTGEAADNAARIAEGIDAIRATGDLQGKPAIFVTGRSDAILPINHTSRPYYGLNQRVEGADSELRYYEVLNAQHLDILNGFADSRLTLFDI